LAALIKFKRQGRGYRSAQPNGLDNRDEIYSALSGRDILAPVFQIQFQFLFFEDRSHFSGRVDFIGADTQLVGLG